MHMRRGWRKINRERRSAIVDCRSFKWSDWRDKRHERKQTAKDARTEKGIRDLKQKITKKSVRQSQKQYLYPISFSHCLSCVQSCSFTVQCVAEFTHEKKRHRDSIEMRRFRFFFFIYKFSRWQKKNEIFYIYFVLLLLSSVVLSFGTSSSIAWTIVNSVNFYLFSSEILKLLVCYQNSIHDIM